MELVNEFTVPRPIEQAWQVLTDVELIAPCLPGAQLTEVEGDTYRGVVKVKVGPILARFAGEARFVELDPANHRAVLDARGKEATGKGLASATVTAQLHGEGDNTRVHVTTDMTISGKIAQFGRGALADISGKLIGQFAERLEELVLSQQTAQVGAEPASDAASDAASDGGSGTADAPPVESPEPADTAADDTPADPAATAAPAAQPARVRVIDAPEAAPVDLLRSAGAPILKRLIPALAVVAAVVVLLVLLLR